MGKLRWTEKASKNLQAVFDYISKDSKVYAARYVKALVHSTRKLENMPRCGRIVLELDDPMFREVIYGNYRIVYRIFRADAGMRIIVNNALLVLAPELEFRWYFGQHSVNKCLKISLCFMWFHRNYLCS